MAVCFLWHFPWGHPRRPLAGTVFPWSPDFPLVAKTTSGRPAVWISAVLGPIKWLVNHTSHSRRARSRGIVREAAKVTGKKMPLKSQDYIALGKL